MKKFFVSAMVFGAVMAGMTSCGAGEQGEANRDTLFSEEFTDSFTTAMSNDIGASLARQIQITEDLTGETFNKKDFLKGLQLIVGSEHSSEYLDGVKQGCQIAQYLEAMKAEGMAMDRDEVLRNIRRLVMADSISGKEIEFYGSESERFSQQLSTILLKREMGRAQQPSAPAPVAEPEKTAVQESPDTIDVNFDELIEVVESTPDTENAL